MDRCRKCDSELDSGIIFCPYCGVKLAEDATDEIPAEKMRFFDALLNHWKKAFVFSGRASITEFWYSYIWEWLMLAVVAVMYLSGMMIAVIPILGWIAAAVIFIVATAAAIVIFIPLVSVTVRRLHDTGRSAWWIIPAIVSMGLIPLVLCALKGDDDVNEYGERPVM